jgi:hypothetical protein
MPEVTLDDSDVGSLGNPEPNRNYASVCEGEAPNVPSPQLSLAGSPIIIQTVERDNGLHRPRAPAV